MTLKDYADRLREARFAHDDAAAKEKELRTAMEIAERDMIAAMVDEGLDTTRIDGVTYTPTRKTYYSCPADRREELLELLEADGYRGAFTVNPNTLNSLMTEMVSAVENGDGELPERYRDIVTGYDKVTISVRGLGRRT